MKKRKNGNAVDEVPIPRAPPEIAGVAEEASKKLRSVGVALVYANVPGVTTLAGPVDAEKLPGTRRLFSDSRSNALGLPVKIEIE